MDRILTKEEKQTLITLLDLEPQYWGDYGRMQKCYKKKCLQLHPDKGGNEELMQQLNTLWTKLKDGLYRVRLLLGPSQVRRLGKDQWNLSLQQTFSGTYFRRLCRLPITCLRNKGVSTCNCILCLLRKQHFLLKKSWRVPCLVLGECYCIDCFALWFGLPVTNMLVPLYAQFLAPIPVDWLDLNVHEVYNPASGMTLMLPPPPADPESSTILTQEDTGPTLMDQQDTLTSRRNTGKSFSLSGMLMRTSPAKKNYHHQKTNSPPGIPIPPPPLFLFPVTAPVPPVMRNTQETQAERENEYMPMAPQIHLYSQIREPTHQEEEPQYEEIPIYLELLPENPNQHLALTSTARRSLRRKYHKHNSHIITQHQRNRLRWLVLMIFLLSLGGFFLTLFFLIKRKMHL
uniref:Middle T antigen n=1 Tax=Hamster polyomavirus TaxID=1891729 RepID=K0F5T5_POVHA|nr:middle T antigen [Alphapolyomavirus mauratus]AFU08251.1 middle T antigen [Alphapolyomavirus mauratus]AFU08256.1 middle T antigen [Alphapolyomavirus mauratus]AFU08260.1 middle T antigen [Alphapolyomavirus mauratus]AFU08265.1 middle T antigen [Alphapolyomavirus mauratus]